MGLHNNQVLMIEGEYGHCFFVSDNEESLWKALYEWVKKYWEEELPNIPMPDTESECIKEYFNECEAEYFVIGRAQIV